eukprot:6202448-Pleurochrysis_carterae.AAC.3
MFITTLHVILTPCCGINAQVRQQLNKEVDQTYSPGRGTVRASAEWLNFPLCEIRLGSRVDEPPLPPSSRLCRAPSILGKAESTRPSEPLTRTVG